MCIRDSGYTARFAIAADRSWTLEILHDGEVRAMGGDIVQTNAASNEPFGEPKCRVSAESPLAVFSIDRIVQGGQ